MRNATLDSNTIYPWIQQSIDTENMGLPSLSPFQLEGGFMHLRSVMDEPTIIRARNYLINTYKDEHNILISKNIFSQYTAENPWPTQENITREILAEIPKHNVLDIGTTHGSLSVESRLHYNVLSLLLKRESLLEPIRKIFSSDQHLFCHLAPAARIVYPGNTVAYVPNHVDIGYNSHITLRESDCYQDACKIPFVTVWIPLQGCAHIHGGLKVYPGTRIEKTKSNDHSQSLWIPSIDDAKTTPFIPNYSIGDCIVFHPWLLHGSAPNNSLRTENQFPDSAFRVSIDVRIFSLCSRTTKHYMNLDTGEQFGPRDGPCAHA